MSAALSKQELAEIAALIGDAKPATDGLLESFGTSIYQRAEHHHPRREDWYCLNLAAYMGERAAPVLRRLLDAEARVAELEAQVATARAESSNQYDDLLHALGRDGTALEWSDLIDIATTAMRTAEGVGR